MRECQLPDAPRLLTRNRRTDREPEQPVGYKSTENRDFIFQLSTSPMNALENVRLVSDVHSRKGAGGNLGQACTVTAPGLEDLSHIKRTPTGTLSGGERQRDRARAREPTLPPARRRANRGARLGHRPADLWLLQRLREQYQMTTLVVTNDAVVAATADRAYRMRDGCGSRSTSRLLGARPPTGASSIARRTG